jgi:hypothetical protein
MILGPCRRSPIVSNKGTAMIAADGVAPGFQSPASLRRMLTSSRSETLSAFEMM